MLIFFGILFVSSIIYIINVRSKHFIYNNKETKDLLLNNNIITSQLENPLKGDDEIDFDFEILTDRVYTFLNETCVLNISDLYFIKGYRYNIRFAVVTR